MVAHCTVTNNAKLITQIIPQFGFELGPSMSGDSGWGTKTSYPPAEESFGDRFGFNNYGWYGFRLQRVKRSTQVNKYLKPMEYGKGPTMSM